MKRLALAIAAVALAGSASAATISSTFDNALQPTDFTQVVTLNKFNPALGTLTGITFNFRGKSNQALTITHFAGDPSQNYNLTTSVGFIFTAPGSPALNTHLLTVIPGAPQFVLNGLSTGPQTITGVEVDTFGPVMSVGSNTAALTPVAAFLAELQGPGTFAFMCETDTGLNGSGAGGNIQIKQTTTAACGGDVTYEYRPTPPPMPEPTSLGLLGVALAGAGLLSRRRKAA